MVVDLLVLFERVGVFGPFTLLPFLTEKCLKLGKESSLAILDWVLLADGLLLEGRLDVRLFTLLSDRTEPGRVRLPPPKSGELPQMETTGSTETALALVSTLLPLG